MDEHGLYTINGGLEVQASVRVCPWSECMVKRLANGKLCKTSYPNRPLTQHRQTRETASESVKA